MEYTTLKVCQKGSTTYVQINRPEIANKLNIPCMLELTELFAQLSQDKGCTAIVLMGQNDVFCTGGELGDFRAKTILEIKEFGAAFIGLHLGMQACHKPIIAAVEGHALGGGFSLVEACDLAVAAEDALFAIPEIIDGLAPAMGLSGIFANLPKKKVMELGMLGTKLTAQEALDAGMVNRVVAKDKVVEAVQEMVDFLAQANPTCIYLYKDLCNDMGMRDYENRLKMGQSMMISMMKSKDGMEVLNSKDEGRAPVWCGE